MNTSIAVAEATPIPASQGIALVGTLLIRSFVLTTGVALVLLAAAVLFVR